MDCGWSGSTKAEGGRTRAAVVRAAMDGDLAAFERLVRCYQAHVWRFLRHLLGDAALAEDVTQETFLRLYQRLPTFAAAPVLLLAVPDRPQRRVDALRAARRRDRLLAALPPPRPGRPPTPGSRRWRPWPASAPGRAGTLADCRRGGRRRPGRAAEVAVTTAGARAAGITRTGTCCSPTAATGTRSPARCAARCRRGSRSGCAAPGRRRSSGPGRGPAPGDGQGALRRVRLAQGGADAYAQDPALWRPAWPRPGCRSSAGSAATGPCSVPWPGPWASCASATWPGWSTPRPTPAAGTRG